jgi:hypothetical protein
MLRKVSYLKDEAPTQRKPIKSNPAFFAENFVFCTGIHIGGRPYNC